MAENIDKDFKLRKAIRRIVKKSKARYGYRRVTLALKQQGWRINHKKVLRIMREENLLCSKFKARSRKYSSYKGNVGKVASNPVHRQFQTSGPNQVWLTDVTEFRLPGHEKKLYLSPRPDTYNGEIISYTLSHHPTIALTNAMLDDAFKKRKTDENLIIHSDQGFHYQHKSWGDRLKEKSAKQSMSGKGNCLDNAPMENFFGILKQEMFYGEKFTSYDQLKKAIKDYIKWYNEERIKVKLNGLSPVEYRRQTVLSNSFLDPIHYIVRENGIVVNVKRKLVHHYNPKQVHNKL